MNPQIKQKWVSALRSGDYQQTQQVLHNKNGFCCLGVLCDLYIKENQLEWEPNHLNNGNYYNFQDENVYLPHSVVEWSGIGDDDPTINDGESTLVELNDGGSTFIEIADVIEKQL
jgi:hypothetical protein